MGIPPGVRSGETPNDHRAETKKDVAFSIDFAAFPASRSRPSLSAAPTSRGTSPVRASPLIGQPVKLVTYRSPSEGMRTAVTKPDATSPGALQCKLEAVHWSSPTSTAALPPMGDDASSILGTRPDLWSMLHD